VTFLFTDVEGSTSRWERDADGKRVALVAHDEVLRSAIEAYGGCLFKHTGDGVCAAFASPRSAVDAAVSAQRELELPVGLRRFARPASDRRSRRYRVTGTGQCAPYPCR
jgi:class 3 adenylate cyclase